VTLNNTVNELIVSTSSGTCEHHKLIYVKLLDLVEECLWVSYMVIVIHSKRGQADHMLASMSSLAAFSSHEGTVDLCPGLLKQHGPQLVLFRFTESRLTKASGEPIINNDWRFNSVDVHRHTIDTSIIC